MRSTMSRLVRIGFFGLLAGTTLLLGPGLVGTADAQFGRNRVQYDQFKWRELNTPHFQILYYPEEEEAVRDAARIAERSYTYLSQALRVDFKDRIPVLLYADHKDFEQTNATQTPDESTQGVTESLKQRMILPLMPSMEEFAHVFTHELVHAFQYNLLGVGQSLNPMQWSPPLWMMEGLAEYLSIGMDANTEIWVKDLVREDDYPTMMQMENVFDQRVYRLGQALYYFLGDRYGIESVRRFFKQTIQRHDWIGALAEVYSKSPKEMSAEWKGYLQEKYGAQVAEQDEASSVATPLIKHEGLMNNLNLTPSVSPDGERIAYVANKNFRDGIYIANAKTGETKTALARGGSSGSLESIDFFESTMSWTRDGRTLAFVSSAGDKDVIHLIDAQTGKSQKKLSWPEMSIISAAVSPDGERVVFSGMKNGQRDLYMASTATGQMRALTRDIHAYLHPAWSPDGTRLALATDAGEPTDARELDFRGYRLALMDPQDGSLKLLTGGSYHDINPVWSPDGEQLAFTSDRTGVPQVFLYDLQSGVISRVTDLATGVSGITYTSPAISWSGDGKVLAFSSYREMGWDIYTMPDPREAPSFGTLSTDGGTAPAFEPTWAGYALGDPATFDDDRYHAKLSADYVMGAGGFASSVGLLGDVIVGFSDMTGNQNLQLYLGLMGSLGRSNVTATYVNMTHRFNWGITAFQQRSDLGLSASFAGATYFSQIFRGGGLLGFYPFSRYSRIEATLQGVNVSSSVQGTTYYRPEFQLQDLGSYNYAEVSLSHVYDNSRWFVIGPIAGQRWRFTVDQTAGDYAGTGFFGDVRKYFNVNQRGALATRTYVGLLQSDIARQFQIGGPTTVHGTEYGQMAGSHIAFQNVELRYPLLPFLPVNWDFLSAALFADAGAAWDEGGHAQWVAPDYGLTLLQNAIVGAVGTGVRANLGYFTIFVDYSWPTDFRGNYGSGRMQFAIGQIF